MPFFQLEYLQQALTNRVRTKSSQTHQRFFFLLYIFIHVSVHPLANQSMLPFNFRFQCLNPIASCHYRFISISLFEHNIELSLILFLFFFVFTVYAHSRKYSVIMIHFWAIVYHQIHG